LLALHWLEASLKAASTTIVPEIHAEDLEFGIFKFLGTYDSMTTLSQTA